MRKKIEEFANQAVTSAREAVSQAQKTYNESGLKDILEQTGSDVKSFLDEKGITEKFQQVTSTVNETFDSISGEVIMRSIAKHIQIQEELNEILADKLAEALERIEVLEGKKNEN